MPIGEFISMMLPRYIRLGFVMLAAFVLGIIGIKERVRKRSTVRL